MHPILLKIGNFELRSWSVAIALSFLVGTVVAVKRTYRFGVNPDHVIDLAIVIIIASTVGSRLLYALYHLDHYTGNWLAIVNPFHHGKFGFAGLSMVGGVILALIASWVFVRIQKLSFLTMGDIIAPGFLLGAGIQRLGGCFLNGCCFGLATDSLLGVSFPKTLGPYPPGTPLWPAQLFASAFGFLGFALICWLERHYRFPGATFWLVLLYYPIDRFIVDQFRYYEPTQILGRIGPLTINANHLLIGGLFVLSAVFWLRGWLKQRSQSQMDTTSEVASI